MPLPKRKLVLLIALVVAAAAGYYGWRMLADTGPGPGFVSGNGRIEATEIDVATKLAGRVQEVLVTEGDFVAAGQPLARMQIDTLQAQREEARAQHQQAVNGAASAAAQVAQRESDKRAAEAVVVQRESELDAARRRDAGLPYSRQASVAKLVATDAAMKLTTDAVQVYGGAGYTRDYRVERYMREAKIMQIFEGTNQIQRLVISRHLAK